jgi:hypothetical protein
MALADRFGACLHLLHAIQSPFDQPWVAKIYAISMADFEATARRVRMAPCPVLTVRHRSTSS